jgi:(p)ppGpp synthase/HD superfamily hydrolase
MTGYSDRINHALAFAAKHHDQQVRKGTRLPYITAAPNVAIILTRYGQDDETVVAGILHDAVEECVRDGYTREMLERRIGEKFGGEVLRTVLSVVERRYDDEGTEMSSEERKDDLLRRLAEATPRARWVAAADLLHSGSTLLSDLRRTEFPEAVWARVVGGREGAIRWFRRVYDRLREAGFDAPIMEELGNVLEALENFRDSGLGTRDSRNYLRG